MAEKIVIEIELPDSIIEALREALDLPTEETEDVPSTETGFVMSKAVALLRSIHERDRRLRAVEVLHKLSRARIKIKGRFEYVAQIICARVYGPSPGSYTRRTCGTDYCVNPRHLEW